jgi:Ni,Fe-hydrogenase III large subunit
MKKQEVAVLELTALANQMAAAAKSLEALDDAEAAAHAAELRETAVSVVYQWIGEMTGKRTPPF